MFAVFTRFQGTARKVTYWLCMTGLLPILMYGQDDSTVLKGTVTDSFGKRTVQLQQFTITGSKKPIELKGGKLTYNVEQSAAAAGVSAFDLLKRMPGVSVDANENIQLNGSQGVNVLMDGKMTWMSAQQLNNMLKSMPSDNISRIEIMTTPPAQYDAAGTAGIINIITRKSDKQGYAANISFGAGMGKYFLHTENITGNVKTSRFNIFGTLGISGRNSFRDKFNNNRIVANDTATFYERHYGEPHYSTLYTYKTGIDLYLSKRNQLGFVYTGSLDDWKKDAHGETFLKDNNGSILSTIKNRSVAVEPYYNNAFNLNYRVALDTAGSAWTIDADYLSYHNLSDGFLSNQSYDKNAIPDDVYQELKFHQPSYIKIHSLKTDLNLAEGAYQIKGGLKYSSVTITNNFNYDSLINDTYVYSPSLSDHFVYKEKIAAAYLSAARQWGATGIDAGLRVEHTDMDGNSIATGVDNKRSYTNLFPTVSLDHSWDKKNKLALSVSRRINRPSYGLLNPVRYFSDKYSYFSGTPDLRPELAWITSLSYSLSNTYFFTLSYQRLNDFIGQSIREDAITYALISQNINFSHKDQYELLMVAPYTVASYWTINLTAAGTYTTYPVAQRNGSRQTGLWTGDFIVNQLFKLPGNSTLEWVAHYTSPELNGIYKTRYYFQLDGGFKKSFLHGKLDARLAISDLFHTSRYWGYSLSDLVQYSYKYIPDSRRVNLSFVYHLGGKLTGGHAHRLEEQERL